MAIIKWSPNLDPFAEMEEMMKNFPTLPAMRGMQRSFAPAVDVYEDKGNIIVEAALAGMDPKDVHVSIEKGIVTIKGEEKTEHEVEEKNYYRKEVRNGSFVRQIPLPAQIQEDKVDAEFCDGMLKITCPKAAGNDKKEVKVKVAKK
ncbi:Hsp20/alpha crystallin family protein [Candidatus Nomurabacteria bacterium]|nr:Hsp20/alpha crystallin family protein [Candidatus Nomurabacteria bacterium]